MKRTTVNPALTPDPRLVTLAAQAPERPGMAFLEVQNLEPVTDPDTGKREVWGLGLPYGEEMERLHLETGATRQVFEPNSAELDPNGAKAYFGHDHLDRGMPVGRVLVGEQTPQGLRVGIRLAKTAKGEEVWTLAQPDEDGQAVLDRFSVGYLEQAYTLEDADSLNPLVRHQSVLVKEVSLVPDPQYPSAKVDQVLDRNTNPDKKGSTVNKAQRDRLAALRGMTTLSAADAAEMATLALLEANTDTPPSGLASAEDVTNLSASLDTLTRQVATLGDLSGGDSSGVPAEFLEFSSYGQFLQAAAVNDPAALAVLAYVGGTVGDLGDWVKDSWVGDLYRPLEERRRVTNLFQQRPLPATGMGVEYGRILSDTTQVAEQVAEGDLLAYGKIAFETDRAPLKTYGGWGDMSRQEIERSSMAIVEKFFSALLRRYAQTTEAAVQAAAVLPANGVALTGGVLDLATVEGWTRMFVRAAKRLDDNGFTPEFALVSWDVFEDVATLRLGTDGPFFLDRNSGRVDVKGLAGEVYNVPLVPITAAVDTIRVCDSAGLASFEAAGAPFRLQDDDITHLTKAFSVYGYEAIAPEDPNAIVRPQTV